MVKRVTIGADGKFQESTGGSGHGKDGQIKKATKKSWNAISINGEYLNKSSLIDYLNSKLPAEEQLSKGFFGLGGATTDDVTKMFYQVLAEVAPPPKETLAETASRADKNRSIDQKQLNNKLNQLAKLPEKVRTTLDTPLNFSNKTKEAIANMEGLPVVQRPLERSDIFRGISLSLEGREYILHICPGAKKFSEADYKNMMEEAAKELALLGITPSSFVMNASLPEIDSRSNFENWQRNTTSEK